MKPVCQGEALTLRWQHLHAIVCGWEGVRQSWISFRWQSPRPTMAGPQCRGPSDCPVPRGSVGRAGPSNASIWNCPMGTLRTARLAPTFEGYSSTLVSSSLG